jgi:hypothetical protein
MVARPILGSDLCNFLTRSSAEKAEPDLPNRIRLRAISWRGCVLRSLNSWKATVIRSSISILLIPLQVSIIGQWPCLCYHSLAPEACFMASSKFPVFSLRSNGLFEWRASQIPRVNEGRGPEWKTQKQQGRQERAEAPSHLPEQNDCFPQMRQFINRQKYL